jgi:hypothetical protein
MKTFWFPKLLVLALLILSMAIPVSVMADMGGGDGGQSVVGTLILDNKNPDTWQRIADGKYGVFTYNSSGDTLNWSLAVAGLGETPTQYSLIYYANPYPGNFPGALIWSGESTAEGRIDVALNSVDLGIDLPTPPDSNMVTSHAAPPDSYTHHYGAKIWLVPSSCYDSNTKSITSWQPDKFLFETDLINYVDTDKTGGSETSLTTTVTEAQATIAFSRDPSDLVFGSVAIGSCSSVHTITITNIGNVPIIVTLTPSAGFYTSCLKLDGALVPTGGWQTSKLDEDESYTFGATVCPLPGLSGTQVGTITYMAEFAP